MDNVSYPFRNTSVNLLTRAIKTWDREEPGGGAGADPCVTGGSRR